MVCNERAAAREIEALDKRIAGFGKRPTAFVKGGDGPAPVKSTDTAQVEKINRELAAIHKIADGIMEEVTKITKDAAAHKRVHLVSWAKNGCPDDPDDEDAVGIELGDALEDALKTRREAVEAVKARLLGNLPIIEEIAPHNQDSELTDEQLLAIAREALANKSR